MRKREANFAGMVASGIFTNVDVIIHWVVIIINNIIINNICVFVGVFLDSLKLTDAGIEACADQDSSLLSVLAQSNALLVRAPHDPARDIGEMVEYLPIWPALKFVDTKREHA